MKIAIDGLPMSHPQPGGYRTYTTNLVHHLAHVDETNEYILFLDRPISTSLPPNWRTEVVATGLGGLGVALREQVGLPLHTGRSSPDLLHSPCGRGPLLGRVPSVVTLHDIIQFSAPLPPVRNTRVWGIRVYNRLVQARMVHKARKIITVSNYSRGRILERFRVSEDRIAVIYNAPATHFRREPGVGDQTDATRQTLSVDRYILALASASPRKNTAHLLTEYAALKPGLREQYPLVLIFAHRLLRDRISATARQLGIADTVRFLEGVSDQELARLYAAAELFVFPSLEEGFGLPPLEAMACGTPVVASNTSCMPEVLGDAALLVSPRDPGLLRDAMAAVLTEPDLAHELVERAIHRVRQFSWDETARRTLDVYRSVAQG